MPSLSLYHQYRFSFVYLATMVFFKFFHVKFVFFFIKRLFISNWNVYFRGWRHKKNNFPVVTMEREMRQAQWKTNICTNFLLLCVVVSLYRLPVYPYPCIIDILSQCADERVRSVYGMLWFSLFFFLNFNACSLRIHHISILIQVCIWRILLHCLCTNNILLKQTTKKNCDEFEDFSLYSVWKVCTEKIISIEYRQHILHVKHDLVLFYQLLYSWWIQRNSGILLKTIVILE